MTFSFVQAGKALLTRIRAFPLSPKPEVVVRLSGMHDGPRGAGLVALDVGRKSVFAIMLEASDAAVRHHYAAPWCDEAHSAIPATVTRQALTQDA